MSAPQNNITITDWNTLNVTAKASQLLHVKDPATLPQAFEQTTTHQPILVMGGGSNILFTQDFKGLILKNEIRGIEKLREDAQHVWLKVGAGEVWHDLVTYCLQHHYAGIENLSLIPGTVGAAPIQNIGAYGVEFESVFDSLEAFHLSSHEMHTFAHKDCEFGYRDSVFKNRLKDQYIITSVTLRLSKTPMLKLEYGAIQSMLDKMGIETPCIQSVSDAVIRIRQSKLPDPNVLPNAGSFFKNPIVDKTTFEQLQLKHEKIAAFHQPNGSIKLSAAWLIEHAGLKGYRENDVGVSPNHALVLINYGNPDGQAIADLASKIQDAVNAKFGIALCPEVRIC